LYLSKPEGEGKCGEGVAEAGANINKANNKRSLPFISLIRQHKAEINDKSDVQLYKDSVHNSTDTGILYFPGETTHDSVIAHSVGRKNLLINKHFHCWKNFSEQQSAAVTHQGTHCLHGIAYDSAILSSRSWNNGPGSVS